MPLHQKEPAKEYYSTIQPPHLNLKQKTTILKASPVQLDDKINGANTYYISDADYAADTDDDAYTDIDVDIVMSIPRLTRVYCNFPSISTQFIPKFYYSSIYLHF